MQSRAEWAVPPARLDLSTNEVHIWRACLDLTEEQRALLACHLTQDEMDRASRFWHERDRDHFVASRGNLRAILSRYTGVAPQHLRLMYNAFGKPFLEPMLGQDELSFNLAHSGGIALYAVARGGRVGIDVEKVDADLDVGQIAQYALSPAEQREIVSLPESQRRAAFYACWTRKEAYLKARGHGLAWPLDQFDIWVTPIGPARLVRKRWNSREADNWSLWTVLSGPDYVATLVAEGRDWDTRCWMCAEELEGCDARSLGDYRELEHAGSLSGMLALSIRKCY